MAGSLRTVQNWMALPCTKNAKLGHFAIQECLFIAGLMPWSKEMSEDPRERADAEKAMKCKILLRTCGHVENVYLKITEHQSPVQVKLQQQSSKWLKRTGWQEWMSTLILLHKAQRGDLGEKNQGGIHSSPKEHSHLSQMVDAKMSGKSKILSSNKSTSSQSHSISWLYQMGLVAFRRTLISGFHH